MVDDLYWGGPNSFFNIFLCLSTDAEEYTKELKNNDGWGFSAGAVDLFIKYGLNHIFVPSWIPLLSHATLNVCKSPIIRIR